MDIDMVSQNLARAKLSRLKHQTPGMDQAKEKELKAACAGFEAIFIHTMVKSMRQSLPGDALLGESHGMDMYKSMYDQHLSDELSVGKTSLGIKEFLYNQLKDSK
jgi:flagellar protein FlgJ